MPNWIHIVQMLKVTCKVWHATSKDHTYVPTYVHNNIQQKRNTDMKRWRCTLSHGAHITGDCSSFCAMKHQQVEWLPSGQDASPLQGVTPSSTLLVPIYTPGWRETEWNKVSCLRKPSDGKVQTQTYGSKSNLFTSWSPRGLHEEMMGLLVQTKVEARLQDGWAHNWDVMM